MQSRGLVCASGDLPRLVSCVRMVGRCVRPRRACPLPGPHLSHLCRERLRLRELPGTCRDDRTAGPRHRALERFVFRVREIVCAGKSKIDFKCSFNII